MDIPNWDNEQSEKVEDAIGLLTQVYDLEPDEVLSALRREIRIRDYNKHANKSGRPSKKEEYFDRFKRIIEADFENKDSKLDELEELSQEMQDEMSRATRYKVRQKINQRYQVHIAKPFHSMDRDNLSELLNLEPPVTEDTE